MKTATYGLVNVNSKWHMRSNNLFFLLGLLQSLHIPQLFNISNADGLTISALKIVDDILISGSLPSLKAMVTKIKSRYELGTTYSPGTFNFYGLKI